MATMDDIAQFLQSPMAQTGMGMLGSTQTPGPAYQSAAAAAQAQQVSMQQQQAQAFALQQAKLRQNFNPSQYMIQPGQQPPPGAIGNVDLQGMLSAGLRAGMQPDEVMGMAGVMDPMTAIRMKLMAQPALVTPPKSTVFAPGIAQAQAAGLLPGGQAGAQGGALYTNPNPPADSPIAQLQDAQAARDAFPPGSPNWQIRDAALQKITGSWEQANPEDVNTVADAIGHYEMAPLTGNAMRSPISQRVMAAVAKNYPQYNAQNYASAQAASDSFAAGPLGDKVRSMNVAVNHLDTLKDAAVALQNGDMKAFNEARQAYLAQTGSAIPTNFDTVHQIVANEVVKAVSGASGGTQSERDEMKANIDKASSFTQLQGSIDQAQKLLGGQLQGLAKQYQGSTMGRRDFADRYLSPRTQKIVGTGEGEGGASAAPTNAQAGGFALNDLQAAMNQRGLLKK